jgi:hypothetical protein
VARINQFRACLGRTPYQRWTEAESCVDQQVAYDRQRDEPHAGFTDQICSPRGNAQNECLGGDFNRCMQSMFNEGPPPQEPCTGQCFQDHGHYLNMTSTRFTRVACGFDGNWSAQNFE